MESNFMSDLQDNIYSESFNLLKLAAFELYLVLLCSYEGVLR